MLRGHTYVATLEARVQTLEKELREKVSEQTTENNRPSFTPETDYSEPHIHGGVAPALGHLDRPTEEAVNDIRRSAQHAVQRNFRQENVGS